MECENPDSASELWDWPREQESQRGGPHRPKPSPTRTIVVVNIGVPRISLENKDFTAKKVSVLLTWPPVF